MKKIPRSAEADRALKGAARAMQNSLDALNSHAGTIMARGDYEKAESLAKKGREIRDLIHQMSELCEKWLKLSRISRGARRQRNEKTPLWEYFQPILRALEALGGEAKRDPLLAEVERIMSGQLKQSDFDGLGRGKLRWQVMVLRARKPMVQEGWLEPNSGLAWRITMSGRRAAKTTKAPSRQTE